MVVTASSDFHGYLPDTESIPQSDLFAIAGDLSPLDCQRDPVSLEEWLRTDFCDWADKVPAKRIAVVAGNHDFCFTATDFQDRFTRILIERGLVGKVVYLENATMLFEGMRIFGCPYSDISNWAYSTSVVSEGYGHDEHGYEKIENDIDLLIVHQAPDFEDLGTSLQTSRRNFGSDRLLKVIRDRKPRHVVCGHIHSGNHNPVVCDGVTMRNVSYLDEHYIPSYKPVTFAI